MNYRNCLSVLVVSVLAIPVLGQGVLVPHHHHDHWPLPRPIRRPSPTPPMSYKIKEISISTRIQDQVARTQVTQSFVNTGSRQMEVSFIFPLPYDGAVDKLTFMVDGKEYDAQLMKKEKAREIYEGYMRRNQDPALLEWMGTGLFKTSVFPIPPGQERSVTLRYTQLLRKNQQLTDYLFPLSTARYTSHAVEKLAFNVSIQSNTDLKSIYSPTHDVRIQRNDNRHALVSYEATDQIPATDFRIFFDTTKEKLGASVISYWPRNEDHGYFLLLASPDIETSSGDAQRKNIILVLDRSGSMNGKKIEQAKDALKYVLNNLHEGDLFNIVAYDSEIESFKPELQRYNDQTRNEAIGFVNGIFAGGSTNIDGALTTALDMIQDSAQPNYVVFLTDGLPTTGTRNEAEIVKHATDNNKHAARLISFGVGYDVNSRLIDRLSRANRGQSEYVRPDEDIETLVSRLYQSIASPVMVHVKTRFDLEQSGGQSGSPVNRVYPREIHDIFAGQQVTMVGRYSASGAAKIKIKGDVNGEAKKFSFPANFATQSDNETFAFVEKLWAARRIGEIIDQLDLDGQNEELIEELVHLSTKHGIVTPYTSFLADDQARPQDLADRRFQLDITSLSLSRLRESGGRAGFEQRLSKKSYLEAARVPTAYDGLQSLERIATTAPDSASPRGYGLGGSVRNGAAFGTDAARPAIAGVDAHANRDAAQVSHAVMHVGKETIYRRGSLLVVANASDVDIEKDKDQIIQLKRFSKEYFELIATNSKSENAVLASQQGGEELLIRLRGNVYLIK